MNFLLRISFLFSLYLLSACGSDPVKIQVPYVDPPKRQISLKTANIAIVPGHQKNQEEKELMSLVTSKIEEGFIHSSQWKVVDLKHAKLRDELIRKNLEESIELDEKQLLHLGRELNVSLIISPDIYVTVEKKEEIRERIESLGTGKWRTVRIYRKDGSYDIPRQSEREVIVSDVWESKSFTFSGKVQLINVENGEVISTISLKDPPYFSRIQIKRGARPLMAQFWYWLRIRLGFEQKPLTQHPLLLQIAEDFLNQVSQKTVNEFASIQRGIPTIIYDDGDLDVGARMAQVNRWQIAADRWEEVLANDPRNEKCLHNLGAAWLALSDLEESALYLAQAIEFGDNPPTMELLNIVDDLRKTKSQEAP